jgi:hypothetical protein
VLPVVVGGETASIVLLRRRLVAREVESFGFVSESPAVELWRRFALSRGVVVTSSTILLAFGDIVCSMSVPLKRALLRGAMLHKQIGAVDELLQDSNERYPKYSVVIVDE